MVTDSTLETIDTGQGAGSPDCIDVSITEHFSPAEWDAFVEAHDDASGYHRLAWRGIVERAFRQRTRYLLARRSDGSVAGVLPLVIFKNVLFGRFLVSVPFVNYGGIVADHDVAASALLDRAVEIARTENAAYIELRHRRQRFPHLPAKRHRVAMVLALADTVEAQWTQLDRKVRNQVRKAEKSQLRACRGGAELLTPFYDVFTRNMRDLGTPAYSRRLFDETLAAFPDRSQVFCIMLGDRPVAASIVLWKGNTIEVPWASAVREYNALCPNMLLYWEMVRFAIEKGFRKFDFGRSAPFEGTYEFKRQWGAQPHELVWEYWRVGPDALPDRSPANPRYQRAISAWQRLPVAVTRLLGPQIVRHIP